MNEERRHDARTRLRDNLPSAIEDASLGALVEYEMRSEDVWGESKEKWVIVRGNRTVTIEWKEKREKAR